MLTCDSYLSPRSLNEALAAAAAASSGRFRFVAGATDILPWAREGRAGDVHVPVMIDIMGIPELCEVRVAGSRIWIGAATPFQRFLDHPGLMAAMPGMADCAIWFADNQIRESATLGGNIMNASPAADGIPSLLNANATLTLAAFRDGKIRRRSVPLSEFVRGPGSTAAEDDEILLGVECDALEGYGGSFEKVGHRRSLVISVVCLATVVKIDRQGSAFEDVRLAIGGVGPVPRRMPEVEELLNGRAVSAALLREAQELCGHFIQSRSRQDYRRGVTRGFVIQGIATAMKRASASAQACRIAEEVANG